MREEDHSILGGKGKLRMYLLDFEPNGWLARCVVKGVVGEMRGA